MRKTFLKPLLTIACLLCSIGVSAHDFEVNSIYYKRLNTSYVRVTYRGDNPNMNGTGYTGTVVIPESVTYNGVKYGVLWIDDWAFLGCSALKEVTIPNGVTYIGVNAFHNCKQLTKVNIPNSVTQIGECAFYQCFRLEEITIPDKVTSIDDYTFYGCGLKSVKIPNSVKSIGKSAFSDCQNLTEVTISNKVTKIGKSAFKYCTSLTEVTIPNKVTSIGDSAFYTNPLRMIKCQATNPPVIYSATFKSVFSSYSIYSDALLYVPAESVSAYKSANYWKNFNSINASAGIDAVEVDAKYNITIYNGTLNITGVSGDTTVNIYRANGVLLRSTTVDNVSNYTLPQGLYLVQVNGVTRKIVL